MENARDVKQRAIPYISIFVSGSAASSAKS